MYFDFGKCTTFSEIFVSLLFTVWRFFFFFSRWTKSLCGRWEWLYISETLTVGLSVYSFINLSVSFSFVFSLLRISYPGGKGIFLFTIHFKCTSTVNKLESLTISKSLKLTCKTLNPDTTLKFNPVWGTSHTGRLITGVFLQVYDEGHWTLI